MRISRIFVDQALEMDQCLTLTAESAHYLRSVLRIKTGAELILFNGLGGEYRGQVRDVARDHVDIQVQQFHPVDRESPILVHLGLAISRGERMDYAIQKAVELGVQHLTPLLSQRCVVRLDEKKQRQRLQHWEGVVQHACEQSGRTQLPQMHPVQSLDDWVANQSSAVRLVLDPLAKLRLTDIEPTSESIALLIGPEGGLDEAEIDLAKFSGFKAIRLGPRVLRTETAAVVGLTALQCLWGDLAG